MMKSLVRVCAALILMLGIMLCYKTSGADTVISGTCGADGDNATWSYSNGVLRISGTGEMGGRLEGADDGPAYPWHYQYYHIIGDIQTVIIDEGITSIPYCAFYGFMHLKTVSIPSSVTRIEECAFANCPDLTRIELSANVSEIGEEAFGFEDLTEYENVYGGNIRPHFTQFKH